MVQVIRNNQIELQAGALDTAATSCFTAGAAPSIVGCLCDVGGLRLFLSAGALILGSVGLLVAAIGLHRLPRQVVLRLRP